MDEEVQKMINEQYARAKQILTEHKEGHAQLAALLVEREVIFAEDVERIFGKRPWVSRAEELLEAQQRAEAEAMAERRARELGLIPENGKDSDKAAVGEDNAPGQDAKDNAPAQDADKTDNN
jgi:cell division protease FtsH